jgi:predicted secreted Zn-dependent protease
MLPKISTTGITRLIRNRENGHTFYGHTDWHVNWHFNWSEKSDGRCRISNISASLTATIVLPQLGSATPEQQEKFGAFIAALRTHELGHVANGREAAAKIDREILALPEMSSCQILQQEANDLGKGVIKEYNERDVQYDAETKHGRTQGVFIRR